MRVLLTGVMAKVSDSTSDCFCGPFNGVPVQRSLTPTLTTKLTTMFFLICLFSCFNAFAANKQPGSESAIPSQTVEISAESNTASQPTTSDGPEKSPEVSLEPALSFESIVKSLNESNFKKKLSAIETLATVDHPQKLPLLKALQNNDVYTRKIDDRVVIATKSGDGYQVIDASTGESLGSTA